MSHDKPVKSASVTSPVVTFRTSWQMVQLLDLLAQLQGVSRSRMIGTALMQYSQDWLGARGHVIPGSLRNRLRRIDILQKRIRVNLQLGDRQVLDDLGVDRKDMLDEAYYYARYSNNNDSFQLLSQVTGWLTHAFDPTATVPEAETSHLQALLDKLIRAEGNKAEASQSRNGAEQAAL